MGGPILHLYSHQGLGSFVFHMDNGITAALVSAHFPRNVWARGLRNEAPLHLHSLRNYELKATLAGCATSCWALQILGEEHLADSGHRQGTRGGHRHPPQHERKG